jgi:hypothetical protein
MDTQLMKANREPTSSSGDRIWGKGRLSMNDIEIYNLALVERDLKLRGRSDDEIAELLQIPVLLIPGPVTPLDSESPVQVLTNHIAFISKDLSRQSITNQVVVSKDIARGYVEERHANVDLGAILLLSLAQLGGLANLAQILDFLLNLIQLRFVLRRTQELTPTAKFDLHIRHGHTVVKCHFEGPANELTKMATPLRVKAIMTALKESESDDA